MTGLQKEALRQQMLLRALWRDARPAVVEGWLRGDPARKRRGLQAYQANAGALAERALAAAYPTIAQLVGAESFAGLARACWAAEAPLRGDVAEWGGTLPDFVAAAPQLSGEPYLADVARVDWAVHVAERAADQPEAASGLQRLAGDDPSRLRLRLRAGTALVTSPYPVATIWLAHRSDDADRFAPVRSAFAEGRGENALVRRVGWRAEVALLTPADAAFAAALLAGATLDAALHEAGAGFDFENWLVGALRSGLLTAVQSLDAEDNA